MANTTNTGSNMISPSSEATMSKERLSTVTFRPFDLSFLSNVLRGESPGPDRTTSPSRARCAALQTQSAAEPRTAPPAPEPRSAATLQDSLPHILRQFPIPATETLCSPRSAQPPLAGSGQTLPEPSASTT